MERDFGDFHPSGHDFGEDFGGEVETGSGRGYRASLLGEDGLVAFVVGECVFAMNVGRQRDVADSLKRGKKVGDRLEAKGPFAEFASGENLGAEDD